MINLFLETISAVVENLEPILVLLLPVLVIALVFFSFISNYLINKITKNIYKNNFLFDYLACIIFLAVLVIFNSILIIVATDDNLKISSVIIIPIVSAIIYLIFKYYILVKIGKKTFLDMAISALFDFIAIAAGIYIIGLIFDAGMSAGGFA
ncbi:MAG: hypothetical protein WCX17_00135 [Parcubacteria group bacterium]|jgi:hypothetical protein